LTVNTLPDDDIINVKKHSLEIKEMFYSVFLPRTVIVTEAVVDVSETCTIKVYEGAEAALSLPALVKDISPDVALTENVDASPAEKIRVTFSSLIRKIKRKIYLK
jgi:hypothetical protein